MSTNIDMHISGSGKIPFGEYNKISVCGSGRLIGQVRCVSFFCSGSSKGEDIECASDFIISGAGRFSGNITAASVTASGALHCDGKLVASKCFSSSGSVKCGKGIKCEKLSVSGSLAVEGGIEAEIAKISGSINCKGLLNAESTEIRFDGGMTIGSIGGSKIVIAPSKTHKVLRRIPFWGAVIKSAARGVTVNNSVEGDEVALEYVTSPRVTGRTVTVGQGCNIALVQYSETVDISPDAKVGRTEKI
ncbi:MAG: hypothetical protein IKL44_02940 [Clostridia bacterium]|nr:hypothetical protein [Clostridia bacterium]